jgi:hypothetical protein
MQLFGDGVDYLEVRNFDRFQQHKDGRPMRWIKLYTSLLDDPEFRSLPDGTKYHVIAIFLLAGRTGNTIPSDRKHIRPLIGAKTPIKLDDLIRYKYLARKQRSSTDQNKLPYLEERRGEERRGDSIVRKRTQYPSGFLRCWFSYPHFGTRSKKAEAVKVWTRLKLEPLTDNVAAWIEFGKQQQDWQKDGGQYVPGFQVWIKGPDFSEPPAAMQPTKPRFESEQERKEHHERIERDMENLKAEARRRFGAGSDNATDRSGG